MVMVTILMIMNNHGDGNDDEDCSGSGGLGEELLYYAARPVPPLSPYWLSSSLQPWQDEAFI